MEKIQLNKDLIPKGVYCEGCPYWTTLRLFDDIGDIKIPYCIYMKAGSIPNGWWGNNEYERIQELLKLTEDELFDSELFSLDLLWDGCKECGENSELDEDDLI